MERNSTAIILVKDNMILMQHRDNTAKIYPDYWGFFGGGIEEETPEECVLRECKEELNYDLENPKLIGVLDYENAYNQGKFHIFIEKYNGSELTLLEGQNMKWCTIEEAKQLKLANPILDGLRVIESYLNGK